ncbi:MAG: hypothetical protein GTN39_03180, partial [Candidatus Aenigmarchaeota archaeon]|nr:hypothetical protein [Candidatus Aenigmarchaeota archaeon]
MPGKEKSVGFFAYPELKGKTSFNITITSQNYPKLKKTVTGTVEAIECRGIAVIISPASQEVCKGLPVEYEVTVKNTGTVSDTYDLETDMGTLEKNKVSLEAGEIEEVDLTVETEELEFGETLVTVRGVSEEISDQNSVSLTVKNCYSAEFGVSPEKFEVCRGDEINYTLALKNVGEFEDDYTFALGDREIGSVSLGPEELKMFATKVRIDFSEGEYSLTFKAFSDHIYEEAISEISVRAKEVCYNLEVSSEDTESTVEAGKGIAIGVKVENTGE